jgi:putative NADH-flavin reductase
MPEGWENVIMKIVVIGNTGNVGKRIVAEALRRGHSVTGITRDASGVPTGDGLKTAVGDINDPESLASVLRGHDVVISAVPFRSSDPKKLIDAVRRSGVKRYLVVGGASSLEVAPGKLVMETDHFAQLPPEIKIEASRGKEFLDELRTVEDLDWTMLSPSALFTAGERTGKFRLGKDTLLTAESGKSSISFEDFSVALLDEVEHPKHPKARFTIGY